MIIRRLVYILLRYAARIGVTVLVILLNDEMILNDAGKMVETEWLDLPNRLTNIQLHEFIVMPNHFHRILQIVETENNVGAPLLGTENAGDEQTNDVQPQQNVQPHREGQPQGIAPTDNHDNNNPENNNTENNVGAPLVDAQQKGAQYAGAKRTDTPINKTVGDMMDAFKSITTVEYIDGVKTLEWERFNGILWQRDYYEHIIRNEQSYHNIADYIISNPSRWKEDKFYEP